MHEEVSFRGGLREGDDKHWQCLSPAGRDRSLAQAEFESETGICDPRYGSKWVMPYRGRARHVMVSASRRSAMLDRRF